MDEQEAFIGELKAVALLSLLVLPLLPLCRTGWGWCLPLAEDFCLTAARSLLKLALEEAGDRLARTQQVAKSAKGAGEHRELSLGVMAGSSELGTTDG